MPSNRNWRRANGTATQPAQCFMDNASIRMRARIVSNAAANPHMFSFRMSMYTHIPPIRRKRTAFLYKIIAYKIFVMEFYFMQICVCDVNCHLVSSNVQMECDTFFCSLSLYDVFVVRKASPTIKLCKLTHTHTPTHMKQKNSVCLCTGACTMCVLCSVCDK